MQTTLAPLLICLILATGPVRAGAWLREPGDAFASVTTTLRKDGYTVLPEYGFYGEYGIGPGLTIGVDINDKSRIAGHALVFARIPVTGSWESGRIALELAVGQHHFDRQWNGMTRALMSFGRDFESRWGSGWINVDTGIELRRGSADPALKLDATLGFSRLSGDGKLRPLVQFESTHIADGPTVWSLTPSVMFDAPGGMTWLVGIEHKQLNDAVLGLKLGIWRSF